MIPLLIDSDIGTYLDDYLAIGLAVSSAEIELRAVTTNDGDATTRARIARRLLDLAGRTDVVVAAGAGEPLLRRRPGNWAGHEGAGILDGLGVAPQLDHRHGAQVIVDEAMAHPGELTILAIGAMTNLALAFALEPRVTSAIKHAVLMGGSLRNGPGWLGVPVAEWNFAADAEAADMVVRSGVPLTIVPFDLGERCRFRRADIARLRAAGSPLQLAIADQAERAMARWGEDETWPFDPMALAYLIDPTLLTIEQLHVELLTGTGRFDAAMIVERPTPDRPANAGVAVDVDVARFEAMLVDRLVAGPTR